MRDDDTDIEALPASVNFRFVSFWWAVLRCGTLIDSPVKNRNWQNQLIWTIYLFERVSDSRTRGHTLKLKKHYCSKFLWKFFFSERVVSRWNALDEETVSITTVNLFKSKLQCIRLLLLLNVFVNASYVDVWRSNRASGWHSLVVTQPNTSHQLLCASVCVCL